MRRAMGSDDEGARPGSRRIAEDRAEILRLIARIRRERSVNDRVVDRPAQTETRRVADPGADRDIEARIDAFEQTLMPALYSLEERLRKLEQKADPGAVPQAPPDHLLGGVVNDSVLPDLLQMLSSNQLTGVFVAEDARMKVELYFNGGEMYHATAGETVGESALFAAFGFEGGRFYFLESDQLAGERTIQANTQFLILEALRQIDEKQGG